MSTTTTAGKYIVRDEQGTVVGEFARKDRAAKLADMVNGTATSPSGKSVYMAPGYNGDVEPAAPATATVDEVLAELNRPVLVAELIEARKADAEAEAAAQATTTEKESNVSTMTAEAPVAAKKPRGRAAAAPAVPVTVKLAEIEGKGGRFKKAAYGADAENAYAKRPCAVLRAVLGVTWGMLCDDLGWGGNAAAVVVLDKLAAGADPEALIAERLAEKSLGDRRAAKATA